MSNGVLRNKKFEIQLSVQKDNPLTPGERRIYSLLVYRQRHDQGTTRRQIAKRCRVGRNCKLNHLARYEQGKWFPIETPAEWWAWKKKDGGHATWKLYSPVSTCPLTESVNSIYWLTVSLAGHAGYIKNQRASGLSVLSGYGRRQTFTALKMLANHNLIVRTRDYTVVKTPSDFSWWADRTKTLKGVTDMSITLSERLNIKYPQDPSEEQYLKDSLNRMGLIAYQRGLSVEDSDIYFLHVIQSIKSVSRITEYCMRICEAHLELLEKAKYDKLAFLIKVFDNWHRNHVWQGI